MDFEFSSSFSQPSRKIVVVRLEVRSGSPQADDHISKTIRDKHLHIT